MTKGLLGDKLKQPATQLIEFATKLPKNASHRYKNTSKIHANTCYKKNPASANERCQ